MLEVTGNLWTYPAAAIVITTNGTVKKDGCCVMGRGCASEAKDRFPEIPHALGTMIREDGNHVHLLEPSDPTIYSFPVKHNWYDKADIDLIKRSAIELDAITKTVHGVIVLPRPGCGNGRLLWQDVKRVLEPILSDRFHVITFK